MSKNTFVMITESVKNGSQGLGKYVNYLENPNHKNHAQTSSIFTTFGNSKTFRQSVVKNCAEVDFKNQQAGKGGRPMQSYAQSFVFSLPPGVPAPTQEQWKKITEVVVLTVCQKLKIPPQHAEKYVFANVHDQAKNRHLNLTVCKARGGEVFKELQKKGILEPLKRAFTVQYELATGFSAGSYKRRSEGAKKRYPKPEYEARKKKEELKQKKEVLPVADTPSFKPKLS